MRLHLIALLALLTLLLAACGSSSTGAPLSTTSNGSSSDTPLPTTNSGSSNTNIALGNAPTGNNVVALSVDPGYAAIEPAGGFYPNEMYTTIQVCVPGTTTCQTIDHIEVDTGSSGLRLLAGSAEVGNLTSQLPAVTSGSQAYAECLPFVESYSWGSVHRADVTVGGEFASSIPVQIVGDPAYSVPADCANASLAPNNTPQSFGANGLIGIGNLAHDCGASCATSSGNGYYYLCTPGTASSCTGAEAALADQLPNPITRFAADTNGIADNNGSIVMLPALPAQGAATASGVLIFGIGTRDNNGLGSATVHFLDDAGNVQTIYNSTNYPNSYVDSGTDDYEIPDNSIPPCTKHGDGGDFDCPLSTLNLQASVEGTNTAVVSSVSFSVESAAHLFSSNPTFAAFDDLADSAPPETDSFAWGLPFFFGRPVYNSINGQTVAGYGSNTFVAF